MRVQRVYKAIFAITLAVCVLGGCAHRSEERVYSVQSNGGVVVIPTSAPTPTPRPTYTPEPSPTYTSTPSPRPSPTPEPIIEELNYIPAHINSNGVNLREQPSTYSNILASYNSDTDVFLTGRTGDWYRVVVDEKSGFIAKRFLTLGYSVEPTPKPESMYTVYPGQFSEADVMLVAQLIYREAPGSTYVGYRALASVVLNRVMNQSGWFPNSVSGVIFQPGQYGYSEEYLASITPNSAALASARYVLQEHGSTLPKKVLFYRAAYLGIEWVYYTEYYATIEGNNFYYGLYYY